MLERIRHCAMPAGEVECQGAWLRQSGEMRFAPGRPWLPFDAEQRFTGSGIDFCWHASMKMGPLVRARVVDSFEGGKGALTAKVFGFLPVARARGLATDVGEALRGLAELPWRPFAFREMPCIAWEAVGQEKLRATFDDGSTQAAVEFEVDENGHVLGGSAACRPRIVAKSVVDTPWSGAFREYWMFDGVRVPTVAEATWHLREGPFTYWRGRVADYRIVRRDPVL